MTNIHEYISNILKKNNIENHHLAVSSLTTSKNLLKLELALHRCHAYLLNRIEKTDTYLLEMGSGLLEYEGLATEIIDNSIVRLEFFYGNNYPESDFCDVPLFMYKALLEDYYFSIKPANFYENGQIKVKGQSYNYLRYGIWAEYYSNGQILSIGEYKNSGKIGTWHYYYESGEQKAIEHYDENSCREGNWEIWFENGRLQSSGFFKRGNFVGDSKRWYENGQIAMHYIYSDLNNYLADGEHKAWHENGNLKSVTVEKNYRTIQYRYYDENGNLERVQDA